MNQSSFPTFFASVFLFLLLLIFPRQGARAQLDRNLEMPSLLGDCAGICIIDIESGDIVFSHSPGRPFVPASVVKALTSASVLSLCDSTQRFMTTVNLRGPITGANCLVGDVIIRCIGDPTIESSHLAEARGLPQAVARELQKAGIDSIAGTVVVEDAAASLYTIPDGWKEHDLIRAYGAAFQPANFADNTIHVTVFNDLSAKTRPLTPALTVERVAGRRAALSRERHGDAILLSGNPGAGGLKAYIANPVAWSTMQAAVVNAIRSRGIAVGDSALTGQGAETALMSWQSPRFIDILRSMMFRSDNLWAEGMLASLAPDDDRAEALSIELEAFDDMDLDTSRIRVTDGSGLSRDNRLTPLFLARLLAAMARSSVGDSYLSLFPRVGKEGTVRNFMKGTPMEGRLRFKTGSLDAVQSYAGYYLDEDGRPTHAVVFLSNGFKCKRAALRRAWADFLLNMYAPPALEEEEEVSPADSVSVEDDEAIPDA